MSYGRTRYIKTERDDEQNVAFGRWLRTASGIRDGMELNRCAYDLRASMIQWLLAPSIPTCMLSSPFASSTTPSSLPSSYSAASSHSHRRSSSSNGPAGLLRLLFVCARTPTHTRYARPRFRSACDLASTVCWRSDSRLSSAPALRIRSSGARAHGCGQAASGTDTVHARVEVRSSSPYVSAARPYAAPSALDEVDYAARARAANFPDAAYLRVATQIRSRAAPARRPPCGRARIPTAAFEGSPFAGSLESSTTAARASIYALWRSFSDHHRRLPRTPASKIALVPALDNDARTGFVHLGLHGRAHAPDNSAFLEPLPLYLEHRLPLLRIPFSAFTFLTALPNPLAVVFRRRRHSLCLVLLLHDLLDAGALKKPKSNSYRSRARVKDVLVPPRSPQSHARLSPASSSSSNAAAHSDSPL
ncbi:hypothetical protein C8R45DRAFT_1221155 [Mycena sanguinolenta]|nr:hypothetical protein C8R45DRAFT_1221155 [Mycena sanguinolenta]